MEDVKKKVFLDLFASPATLLPIAAGLSAWLLSWGLDGNTLLNLGGLVGVLGGIGVFATRLIFGLDSITERAYTYMLRQQQQENESRLDVLDDKLKSDRDSRTEDCLRHLRFLYNSFQSDLSQGRITGSTRQVVNQVEQLFHACVSQLERSYELWINAQSLSGDARRSVLEEREEMIQEIQQTINHLQTTLQELRSFYRQRSDTQLDRLRGELDETMRAAKRAEERLRSIETGQSETADYE